jgi:hypothetical protein
MHYLLPILAQVQSDQVNQQQAAKILGVLGGVFCVFLVIGLVVMVFYLLTLQKALTRCSEPNRAMAPGMVWLMLIPLFNLVWHFFVVINMAKSLDAEFKQRGIAEEPMPGKTLGLAMCILACCSIIPLVNYLTSVGYLICWIIYWVKIAGYSSKIAQ